MKIFTILDALEIPHSILIENHSLLGTETTIVVHKHYTGLLKSINFTRLTEGPTMYPTDLIERPVSREEMSQFKVQLAAGNYTLASETVDGFIYERTGRTLKEFRDKIRSSK